MRWVIDPTSPVSAMWTRLALFLRTESMSHTGVSGRDAKITVNINVKN